MREIAKKCEAVLGARMTGGGFGGSTVNLIKKSDLTETIERISREYIEKTSIEPTILISEAAEGASKV
jgi:galactokinase